MYINKIGYGYGHRYKKYPPKAAPVPASPEQLDKIMALEACIEHLSMSDKIFADSLIKQGSKVMLSVKQLPYLDALIAKALASLNPKEPEQVDVGSFEGLVNIFKKAKEKLKFPKLYLSVDNVPITVSLAGPHSKAPGSINVAGVGHFHERPWYGRVSPEGVWSKSSKVYPEQGSVESLLKALSANPAKAASEYGKLSGCCVFCGLALSDEKSVAAGFGPVCAKNWGLQAEYKAAVSLLSEELNPELEFAE